MRLDAPLILDAVEAEPGTPTAGQLAIYARDIGGRIFPKFIGPSGLDNPIQSALWANMLSGVFPGGGTTVNVLGCTVTNVGTISHPALATTNLKTKTKRFVITSAATVGALASQRPAVADFSRDIGFVNVWRGGLATLVAGMRWFSGVTDTSTTAPTNIDPTTSATPGKIGLAINANTGNLNLVHNITGTAPTVIALGASFPVNTTDLYELILTCAPGAASVGYRVRNISTSAEASGTISTNLPAAATLLGKTQWACNNATASTVALDCSRHVSETDY